MNVVYPPNSKSTSIQNIPPTIYSVYVYIIHISLKPTRHNISNISQFYIHRIRNISKAETFIIYNIYTLYMCVKQYMFYMFEAKYIYNNNMRCIRTKNVLK